MENDNKTPLFNKKYFTISLYALLIIFAGAFIFKIVDDWTTVGKGLNNIFKIFSPFIIGVCVAFILNPLVNWFRNSILRDVLKIKNDKASLFISIAITYILILGLLVILLIFIIPQIYFSLVDLTDTITAQYFVIVKKLDEAPENWHNINIEAIIDMLQNYVPQFVGYITSITSNLIPFIYNTSITFIKGLWNFIIGVIISIYMLGDKENLLRHVKRFIYAIIPYRSSGTMIQVLRESITIFSRYITGKTVDSIIIGLITFIIMSILEFDFRLLISVLVGITNMIPYFGPFIGGAIGVVILLIKHPIDALIFTVVILIIQQFDGLFLGPKILGDSTGLKPLWVIFGITVGGSMFGVIGMLIGVPTVAVLAYIMNILIDNSLKKRNIRYKDGKVYSVSKKNKNTTE